MTNEMIIAFAKEELANDGILKFTGNTITVFDPKTEAEIEVQEVEDIHTCAGWNKRGFKLIKGTTCEIKFKIWTYKKGKKKVEGETEEEAEQKGKCFKKLACWYTREQVEPMTEEQKEKWRKRNSR